MLDLVAIKVRLYPTKTQATQLDRAFGCCRFLWNQMLVVSYCHGEKMSLKYAFMSRLMGVASALGLMPKLSKFTFDGLRAVSREAGCRIVVERASTGGFPFLFMRLAA